MANGQRFNLGILRQCMWRPDTQQLDADTIEHTINILLATVKSGGRFEEWMQRQFFQTVLLGLECFAHHPHDPRHGEFTDALSRCSFRLMLAVARRCRHFPTGQVCPTCSAYIQEIRETRKAIRLKLSGAPP
ncbi:hypothetical protein A2761_00400 [Candidatus Kaiserbacteria bacterium RIFCSPHIGHO2_01_FULL_51_33]|nr:MAG: hypothetical protein A2761_00400 [Candidatus Kaiserbacteria bacterium RIFCSPHIGHO2_01_FULL_51_33]